VWKKWKVGWHVDDRWPWSKVVGLLGDAMFGGAMKMFGWRPVFMMIALKPLIPRKTEQKNHLYNNCNTLLLTSDRFCLCYISWHWVKCCQ
jgi:hypothetical protein